MHWTLFGKSALVVIIAIWPHIICVLCIRTDQAPWCLRPIWKSEIWQLQLSIEHKKTDVMIVCIITLWVMHLIRQGRRLQMCSLRTKSVVSFYIPTSYHLDKDKEKDCESQDISHLWCPGCHSVNQRSLVFLNAAQDNDLNFNHRDRLECLLPLKATHVLFMLIIQWMRNWK